MQTLILKQKYITNHFLRWSPSSFFSTSSIKNNSYEVVVVGGGAGGCATAAKFSNKLGKGKVAIIEPAETHYYQPMFTLVGGGMKTLEKAGRPMKEVLPKKADWIKQRCVKFVPEESKVITEDGQEISYQYLVVAMGIQLNYDKTPGLVEGLSMPDSGVCSNYSELYVNRTLKAMQQFKSGNAVFTFPNSPVKCAGAPQKILYIADEYFKKHGKRDSANMIYNTSLPVIFGVKKYADSLWEVAKGRDVTVNTRTSLAEVRPDKREAVFDLLDKPGETTTLQYSMLHVAPVMGPPDVIKTSPLADDALGFLSVNKETLQHTKYANVFGIGDCTNTPNAKTAAAVAAQVGVLKRNLQSVMNGGTSTAAYNGYSSCPLVTGYSKCILAEFDYDLQPLETFPIDQGKERRSMFYLKKDFMPDMYWRAMLKGYWEGPGLMRKALHLGMK